ncbi:DUF6252 family protein [Runella sp.]|jgi:hypothetical protein|uniref:DUF6252 family protein n=1 Tax=Runella sp. TaxID=1960881 RepID=UPI00262ECEFD|nr:DUF6252 family protein [Runella sp.]
MKKLFVVFISLNFIAATCGKKVEDVIPTLGAVSMKVNGANWTGQVIAIMIDNESLVVNAVNPTVSNQETVGIVVGKVTQTGTYKVKGRTGNAFIFSSKAITYSGIEDGEVTVTAIKTAGGKTVPSGTFKATCIAPNGTKIVVTEGKF